MAHTPEKKAQAVLDVVSGKTLKDSAEAHGVDPKTLRKWMKEAAGEPLKTPAGTKTKLPREKREKGIPVAASFPASPEVREAAREIQREKFIEAVEESLIEVVGSIGKMLKLITDPEFARTNAAYLSGIFEAVHERAAPVLELAQRVIESRGKDRADEE